MGVRITQKRVNSKKFIYSARWLVYEHQKVVASGQKCGFYLKKEAEAWAESEYEKHSIVKAKPTSYTTGTMLDEWVKLRKTKLAPSTYKGYKVNIEHMRTHIGDIKPMDLQFSQIQNMIDALTDSGLHEKTVRYIVRTLHAAIQYAITKMRIMTHNPAIGLEITQDETPFTAKLYSAELLLEMLTTLKEMEHELYAPVLLASNRGLRRGEALALEWSQIDFDGQETTIKDSYNKVKEGPSTRTVKSKESKRKISVKGKFAEELKGLKAQRETAGRITRWVCEYDNGRRMEASHLSRYLGLFQLANGFPKCRFHDLRHTCAKLNIEAGTDLDTLRRLLGHSKISITSDLYLHENMIMLHQASDALEEKVFKFKKPETEGIETS